jgi:alkylation response protein AidB-like acyl-CoA dehydrogenase
LATGTKTTTSIDINKDILNLLEVLGNNVAHADEVGETQLQSIIALKESCLLGCITPKKYGGLEKSVLFASRLIEKIATVDPSIAIILFQHLSVVSRIIEWGTENQKNTYLPLLSNGEWIGASAWSEKNAGANKQNISTQAKYLGEDRWIINGSKTFTTGAGLADLYLVLIQTSNSEKTGQYGNSGQSFFLLETDDARIREHTNLNLSGMRGSSTGFIELIDVNVTSSNIIGPLGGAPKVISNIRSTGLSLGAVSVGISQSAYTLAKEHIIKNGLQNKQSLQLKLSELNMLIEAARSLVERSAEGNNENQCAISYQSKIFASEVSEKVCRDCQQIIGGQGFIRGNIVERFYRDARAIALMGPVNDLAKEIIGRELMG